MVKVQRFFKREDKKPFSYSAIEERRSRPNYFLWAVGAILLIAMGLIFYILIKPA